MKNASFVLMYGAFFLYSLSGIFSKLASGQTFLSLSCILCFSGIVVILGIYAILWQQVLKRVPLSVAIANKPVVIVLGLLWASLLFGERLTAKLLMGVALILVGVILIGGIKNEQ